MRSIKQLNSFEEWTFISEHENIVKFEAEPYILIYGFGLKYILACTPIKKHNWNQNDWWLDDRSDCLYKTWLKSVICSNSSAKTEKGWSIFKKLLLKLGWNAEIVRRFGGAAANNAGVCASDSEGVAGV